MKNIFNKFKRIYKEGGVTSLLSKSVKFTFGVIENGLKTIYFQTMPAGTFKFNKQNLRYYRHNYNLAYQNERTVEVSIISEFLNSLDKTAKILEVGNVLSNYGFKKTARDVLDKYDLAPQVINEDVISFNPSQKYDAIISISTLEHVGWDEEVKDPDKITAAIKNLKENCLSPGGCILVTIPLGYNAYFDEQLENGAEYLSEKYFLKRISAKNKWMQVDYDDVVGTKFGQPYVNANAMCIGIVRN